MDHYMEQTFESMRIVREEKRAAEGEVEAAAVIAAGVVPDENDYDYRCHLCGY